MRRVARRVSVRRPTKRSPTTALIAARTGVIVIVEPAGALERFNMEARKIVQIALDPVNDDGPDIHALCDDGTLWFTHSGAETMEWTLLPNVPQKPLSEMKAAGYHP